MKLALVRYGDHTNGHLNQEGKQTMMLTSERLKALIENKKVGVICAKVPRAIESAEVIAKELNIADVQSFQELYAAPEDGVAVNLEGAVNVIDSVVKDNNVIVAVVSREYIEVLPNYILKESKPEPNLKRGEILVIDYAKKVLDVVK